MRRLNLGFSLKSYSSGPSPVPFFSRRDTTSDPYRRRSRDGLRRLHDRRAPVQRDAAMLAALRHCQQPPGGWCSAGAESVRSIVCVHDRLGDRCETAISVRFRRGFCRLRRSLTEEGKLCSLSGAYHRVANVVTLPESTGAPRNSKPFGNGEGVPDFGTRDLGDGTHAPNRSR